MLHGSRSCRSVLGALCIVAACASRSQPQRRAAGARPPADVVEQKSLAIPSEANAAPRPAAPLESTRGVGALVQSTRGGAHQRADLDEWDVLSAAAEGGKDPELDEAAQAVKEAEDLASQAEVEQPGGASRGEDSLDEAGSTVSTTLPPLPKLPKPAQPAAAERSRADDIASSPTSHEEAQPQEEMAHTSSEHGGEKPVEVSVTSTEPPVVVPNGVEQSTKKPKETTQAAQMAEASQVEKAVQQAESVAVREILREATLGSKEQMKDVSEMFGDIRRDMYRMNDKIGSLQREIEDGVKIEPPDPADSLVYPLSVCTRCILVLTVLYFVLYTSVSIYNLLLDFLELGDGGLTEQALRAACDAVLYAPMLCVLFLGAQLRALQISRGEHGPQEVAELAMEACTWSVVVQAALVLIIPLLTGEVPKVSGESRVEIPELDSRPLAGLLTLVRFAAMMCLYVGCCVICIAVVLMDTRSLGAEPVDLWDDPTTSQTEYAPVISAAMACTVALTLTFFLVYLLHAVLHSTVELFGGIPGAVRDGHDASGVRECVIGWEHCLKMCTYTVNLAPMLCILFMAARMRALQINPRSGRPQWWAESCFYWCTASMIAHVVIVLLAQVAGIEPEMSPALQACLVPAGVQRSIGGKPSQSVRRQDSKESRPESTTAADEEAHETFAFPPQTSNEEQLVVMARIGAMSITYLSCIGVVCGVLTLRAPEGRETPLIPPSLHCVLLLAGQYFMIYLCLFLSQVAASAVFSFGYLNARQRREIARSVRTFSLAECTAKLCPMLAVLFIGARLRAVQINRHGGSPQCWAQDAMYSAAWALLVQLLMVLAVGQLASTASVDPSLGAPVSKGVKYVPGRIALVAVKVLTCVALYGSIILVAASIMVIRPETAGCVERGYHPAEAALF